MTVFKIYVFKVFPSARLTFGVRLLATALCFRGLAPVLRCLAEASLCPLRDSEIPIYRFAARDFGGFPGTNEEHIAICDDHTQLG